MNASLSAAVPAGPGGLLAQERTRRGWNVPDTAEKLHLEPRVVEAIEANQFDRLGPAVFAKGHLKQYALLLGVPVEPVLEAYQQVLHGTPPSAPAVDDAPRTSLPMAGSGPRAASGDASHTPFPSMAPVSMWAARWARLPRWALPAIVGALLLVMAGGVLLWMKPWHRASTQLAGNSQGAALAATLEQPPTPVSLETVPPTGVAPALPVAAAPASAPAAAPSPPGASVVTPGAPAAGRLRMQLSFTSSSWVEVRDASGAMVFRGKGAANSVKSISGAAPLQVFLGAVSGVQLELNRHAVVIGPQFVRGDVARFEVGADGVLRRAARP